MHRFTSVIALSLICLLPLASEARTSGPASLIPERQANTTNLFDSEPKTTKSPRLPAEVIQQAEPPTLDLSRFSACPVDVEADDAFTCIRRGDGTAECFGYNAPSPSGRFMDIDTGRDSFCGVRVDGRLSCSSTSSVSAGVANAPYPPHPGLPFRQVSAGLQHACAVDDLGQVRCWGLDRSGQVSGAPNGVGFTEVAAAGDQTCALQSNGAVHCWGDLSASKWVGPPPESFVQIDADTWTICGISVNGGLYCWGDPLGPWYHPNAPGGSYTAVDAGVWDACALEPGGTPHCWFPRRGNQYGASSPPPNESFVDIAVGYHHACGLTDDSRVLCWGRNQWGEGSPPTTFLCNPDAEVDWEVGYSY